MGRYLHCIVLGCWCLIAAAAQPDIQPENKILARWPAANAAAVRLLSEIGVDVLLTTPEEGRAPETPSSIMLMAEIAPGTALDALPAAVKKARDSGYAGVAVTAAGDEQKFRQFLASNADIVRFVFLKPEQIAWNVAPAHAVLISEIWPGLRATSTSSASASERPWLNANLHLYAWLRARFPSRPALLACVPDNPSARYDSVEVGLAEAFATGGNQFLTFPDSYRAALLAQQPRAQTAWRSLARLTAFVKQHAGVKRQLDGARAGIVAGPLDEVEEIFNLAFRNNLSPRPISPSAPLPPVGFLSVANTPVEKQDTQRLLTFVGNGGTVLATPPDWWSAHARKVRSEESRDIFSTGKGTIYAYKEAIIDPAEFSLDLRDMEGVDNPGGFGLQGLDFRLWNVNTALGTLHRPAPGKLVLILTLYGNVVDHDFLVGVRGKFRSATFEDSAHPAPQPVRLMPHGGRVELNLKGLGRTGIITLEELGQ